MGTAQKRIMARCGNLRLWFHPVRTQWTMTGGTYGEHAIYEPCYNDRVHAHWDGYCVNNGHKHVTVDQMPQTA